jgi:cell division transport system permease protein
MRANFILSGVLSGTRRNLTMTIALILNTAIALTFVGAAYLASTEISNFKHDYEGRLNVSVYLCTPESDRPCDGKHATSVAQTDALSKELNADPLVSSVKYVSPKEQYQRFQKIAPKSELAQTTQKDLFASFTVKLNNIQKDFGEFAAEYANKPGVSGVSNEVDALKTLLKIINGTRLVAIGSAVVALIAAILLIANAISVAASQRKDETSIMRLVGASRWMTELPFMLEAIISTIIGGIIAVGLLALGKHFVLNGIFRSPVERGVIPDLRTNDVLVAGGIGLIAGIVLAAITAITTLRLYVKL